MGSDQLAARLRRLPTATVLGEQVRVAVGWRARLLGLALIDLDRAGSGLLIPRCRSIHTLGMRFALDLLFLDRRGAVVSVHRAVAPGRLLFAQRAATAVLELPGGRGRVFDEAD
jgi:uncharacterized membrane protein (UPF0127 family)